MSVASILAAFAFWIFVAVIVVASILGGAMRHRETQKTIRQAIERGQALDPETLERLLRSDRPPPPTPGAARGFLLFGGVMLLAVGAGLCAIGWFSSQTSPGMLYQGLGAGSLVGLLGIGLLVVRLFIRARDGRE